MSPHTQPRPSHIMHPTVSDLDRWQEHFLILNINFQKCRYQHLSNMITSLQKRNSKKGFDSQPSHLHDIRIVIIKIRNISNISLLRVIARNRRHTLTFLRRQETAQPPCTATYIVWLPNLTSTFKNDILVIFHIVQPSIMVD